MGSSGAARDSGIMKEKGGSVVRANEDEDGKSAVSAAVVFVGPPAVGGWVHRPLLDGSR